MFNFSRSSLLLLIALFLPNAVAQLDSSSTSLLRPKSRSQSPESLDSSKYKIRAPESRRDDDDLEEKPGTIIPTPVPVKEAVRAAAPTAQAEVVQAKPAPPEVPSALPAVETPAPPVSEQVRDLILGGSPQEIEALKKQIRNEDPRSNIMGVSLAPGYYYNGSASGYSYRRYHSNGPALGLGMNLWITPVFGIQSKFFTSVSGSQRSGGVNFVSTELQEFAAGFRFRKYFGFSRKAPHLEWGLDYHDSSNKISRIAVTAIGRKSSGLSLAIDGVVPSSVSYATTFGLEIRPRMSHSELTTGVDARSGVKNETNGLGVSIGGQWTLDRKNQIFWQGRYTVERNLFSGEASLPDPHSGLTPDGVSVTNSLMMIHFGFKWGS